MTTTRTDAARELWKLLEPIHAVTYFSPEPLAALKQAGYRGFWMGYFAGRAAPLGAAPAQLVQALFHNFAPDHITRALPDAWSFAPPEAALDARLQGSVATLRRVLGKRADAPEVARAAELATGTPTEVYAAARNLGPEEWDAILEGFRVRGFVDDAGVLSDEGRDLKAAVERQTDDLAAPAYAGLSHDELAELMAALLPVAAAVVAAGEIPAKSPMGLDLAELSPAQPAG